MELKGKKYRLLFTLNALEELQDKCGGYDKLPEVFNQNNKDWVKDTKWLLTMLINEGLLEEDENAELLSEDKVGRLIHLGNIREVQNAILHLLQQEQPGTETGTKRKAEKVKRGKWQPCRKIRYCTAFVYRNRTTGVQRA